VLDSHSLDSGSVGFRCFAVTVLDSHSLDSGSVGFRCFAGTINTLLSSFSEILCPDHVKALLTFQIPPIITVFPAVFDGRIYVAKIIRQAKVTSIAGNG
jgi:hypothetical protein